MPEGKISFISRWEIPYLVWLYIAIFYLSGLAAVCFQGSVNRAVALLCSMAFAVLGSLLGFLFAIPRGGRFVTASREGPGEADHPAAEALSSGGTKTPS